MRCLPAAGLLSLALVATVRADAPVASYLFPAGGQRGQVVQFHVGGLYLHQSCRFEMLGPGLRASDTIRRTPTLWFEGPVLPLPDSQQAEDYPKELSGQVQIAADAPLGLRYARLWNAQGVSSALKFMVGSLPEIIERESEGSPIPVPVTLPVTVNGRIFPREDVDIWSFRARQGQDVTCEVHASRLGSPLDASLEIRDEQGTRLAGNDDASRADPLVRFRAPKDGTYQVWIQDVASRGSQAHVYRLTITADVYVDHVYPLGGRQGEKTRFMISGQLTPAAPVEVALPSGLTDYVHSFEIGGKPTNPVLLDLDQLPEVLEVEPNDQPLAKRVVAPPVMANGRIDKPGDRDYWAVRLRKGDRLDLRVRAGQLGSRLDGVLAVCDSQGKELARSESPAGDSADIALSFAPPTDGLYFVRIQDRFPNRGGPAFGYRLRMAGAPAPDFRLILAAGSLAVSRGGEARLKATLERSGGFNGPIDLAVKGLPQGVEVAKATIPPQQTAVELVFKAKANARISGTPIMILGSAQISGQTVTRTALLPAPRGEPKLDRILLAVTLPTPFKIVGQFDLRWAPRGSVYRRQYQLKREGYQGPIHVSLADHQMRHLQGVTGPTITVPASATSFEYGVYLPPWMEIGRTSRACVMGFAMLREPDGSEHTVSYTSTDANEQLIAIVEPGKLGLDSERGSILAAPGSSVAVPIRLTRSKGLSGPARVELIVPEHMNGIRMNPVVVPPERDSANCILHFAPNARGPYNAPIVLRAVVGEKSDLKVAEARIEVVAQP